MATSSTYSFMDVQCAIADPLGSFGLGDGAGVAEEGITVSLEGDKATLAWGADGAFMHSLHAAQGGTVAIRLQKTSPVNSLLAQLYSQTTVSSANYGNSTITVRSPARGDTIVCSGCGLRKMPDNVNAKDGGMMEWTFNAGFVSVIIGDGNPERTTILAGITG